MDLKKEIQDEITGLAQNCNVKKVILFGFRARGDNRDRSDIDLAVTGGNVVDFRLRIDEEVRTLLMFDVVNLDRPVNLFAVCFEQSWKAMKEILENHGYSRTASPKMIIKLAYSAGMIQDEESWLELLDQWNEVAHSYNEETALVVIEKTKETYLAMFEALKEELLENWM